MDLPKELNERLKHIEALSRNLWKDDRLSPYFYTPHDTAHSLGVISKINSIIPKPKKSSNNNNLNDKEWFYLYCAAWLHDVGMIPYLFEDEQKQINKDLYLSIREQHHYRSKQFVEKNYKLLGLQQDEAQVIGELCRLHRRRENINSSIIKLNNVRVKLLGAYLRIADALAIDSNRADEFKSLYNLFLAHGMPLSSEFHWLRSFWIKEIKVNHNDASIMINFNLRESDEIDGIDYLCKTTVDDIAEEIASCKDVLLKSKISYFTDVKYEFNNLPSDDEKKAKLKQVISKLKMQNTASSSQLADIMMDTISYIAKYCSRNKEDALQMIKNYTISEIGDIKKDRPCHILVKYVESLVNKICSSDKLETKEKLSEILKHIKAIQTERSRNIEHIADNAKSLLTGHSPILLFGYSSIIIKIFENVKDENIKENIPIYILECRSKNQLNFKNDLIYCDGLRYANHLANTGFKNIYFVPDIITGNLIASEKVQKVFFGANTVDIKNKKIGHTAGHNTIIHSAYIHKVPIYIFADIYKFGILNEEDTADERKTDWFTGSSEEKEVIKNLGIKYYNPRSDVIPMHYVHEFYTEYGNFPPSQVPQTIENRISQIRKMFD
ncbi:MAG: hypothetical protein CVU62_00245 [Deltaproteobacteria bacterium HGW-Deltaproteobacteria-2]|jgi:translation initiation factor 2B subunit (eIF-2B alpha/beta/delta family)|nr:MAG: hypothetical protein CVU62_00245 [Deltaproteobacteria bacterium HGW-Deltaproteobacteria-2]